MVVFSLLNGKFLADAVIGDFGPDQMVSFADRNGEGDPVGNFFSIQEQFGTQGGIDRQLSDRFLQVDVHLARFARFHGETRVDFLE